MRPRLSFVPLALLLAATCLPASASDKVVVACPAKPDMKLLSVYIFQMPEGHLVHGSHGVRGTAWDLTSLTLDPKQHLVLDCGYGAPDAPAGTRADPQNRVIKPVPEDAGRCWRSAKPVAGRCYAK